MSFRVVIVVLLIICNIPNAAATDEDTDPYQGKLLGDLGGRRKNLADDGVDFTLEYKADYIDVASGGIKTGLNYLDNLDIKFALDNEKLFGFKGNKALIYFIDNNGGKPNLRRIGSVQGVDNIEVNQNGFKLFEAWDDQRFYDGKLSVLFGLHDLNSEFDETDVTANFNTPTMQIGQELAQSGRNGPSIFPTSSLAVRVKYTPNDESYLQAAVFTQPTRTPLTEKGTHINFYDNKGLLLIAEAGLTPPAEGQKGDTKPNQLAVGIWSYTKSFNNLNGSNLDVGPSNSPEQGIYLASSYRFFHDKAAGQDIDAFFRVGYANPETLQTDLNYQIGLVANGFMPSRSDSEIGVGLSQAHESNKYADLLAVQSQTSEHNEYSFETYYRDRLNPGISIQPDFQYIINPGYDPHIGNATVLGLRLDINF